MAAIYPEIRRRGDYGFPNNPIGRNARDRQLFVDVLGYSPVEALTAATNQDKDNLVFIIQSGRFHNQPAAAHS